MCCPAAGFSAGRSLGAPKSGVRTQGFRRPERSFKRLLRRLGRTRLIRATPLIFLFFRRIRMGLIRVSLIGAEGEIAFIGYGVMSK